MSVTIVAGAQWGDEGKGRIVDFLAAEADLVVRCQGGPNAGHTVINDKGRFILHGVPSGIFYPQAQCIIGPGTVINPIGLMEELKMLESAGIDIGRLLISERAHLIMPYHRLFERLDEESRSAGKKIGSTGQGIAPAYADKALRYGMRAGDFLDMDIFRRRLSDVLILKNRLLSAFYDASPLTEDEIIAEIEPAANYLRKYIGDTVGPVSDALSAEKRVLLEGQLGIMRDLDWGVYPFVTSSNPTPAGMVAGAGVPPQYVERSVGVVKAYTTAVGASPFPTELTDDMGNHLREHGGEFGATTGRPRRCGWFDAAAVAWGAKVTGFTDLVLTKLDILDGLDKIQVCVGYELNGKPLNTFPSTSMMNNVEPIYEVLPGWTEDTSKARKMSDLPENARKYVDELELLAGVPITMVSVGPERDSIISRKPAG